MPNPFSPNAVVYAIGGRDGLIKIGMSRSPDMRAAQLAGSPLYWSVQMPRADAYQVERIAHHLLAGHRIRGEWFDITVEVASRAILDAVAQYAETGRLPPSPPKEETVRIHVMLPRDLTRSITEWRARQVRIPTKSEAIRALVEKALED